MSGGPGISRTSLTQMAVSEALDIVERHRSKWAATEADLKDDAPDVARRSGIKARAASEIADAIRSRI